MSHPPPSLKPDRLGARARLFGVVAVVLVGLGVWSFPPLCDWLPDLSYDLAWAFRSASRPAEVVLVTMDDLFHQTHETRESQRQAHARLTRRLQESQARLLIFDVGFSQPALDPAVDRDMARAFRDFGSNRVFVADKVETTELASTSATRVTATWHTPTLEVLQESVTEGAALRSAGTVRRFHPEGEAEPQKLLIELAAHSETSTGARFLKYYGPEGTIPRVSYGDVLDQTNLDPRTFAGKAVFVGQGRLNSKVGKAAPIDIHPVPFTLGGSMSGVEIQATGFLNLLRRETIQEAPPWVNLLLIVAVGGLISWGVFHRRPAVMLLWIILASLGVCVLGISLQLERHLLIPWLIPAAIQIPLAGLWSWAVGGTNPHQSQAAAPSAASTAESREAVAPGSIGRSEHPLFAPGAIIADHELVKRIDAGSYGEVWLARNPIGQLRAIKTVTRAPLANPVILEREFHGIQRFMPISFNHPGLVRIFHLGLGAGGNSFYYVLELADPLECGPQLNPDTYQPRTLRNEIRRQGRLPLSDCVRWGVALADALGFLHEQGLVHRDIKPSNLIFVEGRLKLADIGCVTDLGERASYIGTEGYLAPEGPGRPTADVFSLGMVLYEMVTGLPPSQFPEAPSVVLEGADADLWLEYNDLLIRCCEEVPSDRFQTAQEVSEALGRLIPAS